MNLGGHPAQHVSSRLRSRKHSEARSQIHVQMVAEEFPKVPPPPHDTSCHHMEQQLLSPAGWVSHFPSGCQTFMSLVLLGFSQWKTMGTAPALEDWQPAPLHLFLRAFPRWPGAEGCPDYSDSSADFGFTLWETCTVSGVGGKGI